MSARMRLRVISLLALLVSAAFALPAAAQPLDVDGNGEVDVFTDVVYVARYLLGLPPVPQSFREIDPSIPADAVIAARIVALVGNAVPTVTPTQLPTQSRTPTSTKTARPPTASPTVAAVSTSTVAAFPTSTLTSVPPPTPTTTPMSPPSPTPQVGEVDAVQGAAEVAVQNPTSLSVLDFGCIFAGGCSQPAGQSSFRLAAKRRSGLPLRGNGSAAVTEDCSNGGTRESRCEGGVQLMTFTQCKEFTSPSAHSLLRNGVTAISVLGRDLCAGPPINAAEDTVRIELRGYSQVERGAANQLFADVEAGLTDEFAPARDGCAGQDGLEHIDGPISLTCQSGAESLPCPRGGTDLSLVGRNLQLIRRSGGFPCELGMTITGTLDVNDRLAAASYSQRFDGLLMTETQLDDASTRIKQDGALSVDCLGALRFATRVSDVGQQTGAIVFPPDAQCPVSGVLEVTRPPLVAAGGGSAAAAVAGVEPRMELRADLFRALNGQAYQLLQNTGVEADLGAESFRVTTLVGSAAGSVGACANAAGATSDPQAVAGAEAGKAFPPELVFKSPRIPFASDPCFNRNASNGDGRLCIGPSCTAGSCVCPAGGTCTAFTIGGGTPITQATDIPAASLVSMLPPLADPCSGFAGRATYRFGAGGPTTETRQCNPAPGDGFSLPSGSSIVFAYAIPLTSLFNAGFGGYAVDGDGRNLIGCKQGPNEVLHLGRANLESVPAPIITFLPDGRVQFDFDGDGIADRTTSGSERCKVGVLSQCRSASALGR